jgi:hypothetical protein
MIAARLVRLIQEHSNELATSLVERAGRDARLAEMRKVPAGELRQRAYEVYRNLSDWLLTKTEADIERTYSIIGARRASQGVALSHVIGAIQLVKTQLFDFLNREGLVERHVELFQELELLQLVDQFFDRAIYYTARGHEHAAEKARAGEKILVG